MPAHVLLYDHSAVILANFQHFLLQHGFQVTARFPREIEVAQVRKHAPDVIVLAMQEGVSGNALERIVEVHDDPTTAHIPVVIATPVGQRMSLELPMVGMTQVDYIAKPFNIDAVIAAVENLAQKR